MGHSPSILRCLSPLYAMKRAEYDVLRAAVSLPCSVVPDFDALLEQHPGTSLDALRSIYAAEATRRVRVLAAAHRRSGRDYALRYAAGEDLLALAAVVDMPPCSLLRLVLESLLGLSTRDSSRVLRNPGLLPDPLPSAADAAAEPQLRARLAEDVQRAVAWDHLCSPLVELPKAAAGAAYEARLEAALRSEGIPFASEADLRQDGMDVRLEVPVAVRGRVVHWIDSKAMFGDPQVHSEKGLPQFQAYVNRYGPGLVIYWFGFVAELDSHPQVALASAFPPAGDIKRLPMLLPTPPAAAGAERQGADGKGERGRGGRGEAEGEGEATDR